MIVDIGIPAIRYPIDSIEIKSGRCNKTPVIIMIDPSQKAIG